MTTPTNDPLVNLTKTLVGNAGKSVEKFLLYVGTTLSATNVFGSVKDGSVREWLTLSLAAILTGLHISTPTPKSGPGQV